LGAAGAPDPRLSGSLRIPIFSLFSFPPRTSPRPSPCSCSFFLLMIFSFGDSSAADQYSRFCSYALLTRRVPVRVSCLSGISRNVAGDLFFSMVRDPRLLDHIFFLLFSASPPPDNGFTWHHAENPSISLFFSIFVFPSTKTT